ncbi:hypothetical protein C8F04DRAFT_1092754 [Mycena alexandri]|uniref:FAD-binding domain-containing protein n=1 Tax=Mycena alexandri TaxID=1745969 RepID=A0AAD6T343_9AGAR|nr:hypothetical protein C8F04DRAFT_1092754 [Mycena alexandri]
MAAVKVVGIVGAAIAGPTLGLQLLSHPMLATRFKPIIFDKAPAPLSPSNTSSGDRTTLPSAGAAVALFSNGLFPLYNLGMRVPLDAASTEMSSLTVWRAGYGSPDGLSIGRYKKLNSCNNPSWNRELQTSARAIERDALQRLLVSEYVARGGDMQWSKNATAFSRLESGQIQVRFADGSTTVVDLLVGADSGFSAVRKFILHERDPSTAEARWLPDFMGMTGFYGISTPGETKASAELQHSTHAMWLDNGNLSVAPLPDGKMRWDLIISERNPPNPAGPVESSVGSGSAPWMAAIMPGMYTRSSSVEILKRHAGVYHPVVGSFGALLASAERIIRSPLRQRVWVKEEIQCGNVVLIGDAARLMLPSSGQGTGFAVEDATVLANTLLNFACGLEEDESDIHLALDVYAAQRVPRSKKMAYAASLAGLFGLGERWYWRWLRDLSSRITIGTDMKQVNGKEPWPFNERVKVQLGK